MALAISAIRVRSITTLLAAFQSSAPLGFGGGSWKLTKGKSGFVIVGAVMPRQRFAT